MSVRDLLAAHVRLWLLYINNIIYNISKSSAYWIHRTIAITIDIYPSKALRLPWLVFVITFRWFTANRLINDYYRALDDEKKNDMYDQMIWYDITIMLCCDIIRYYCCLNTFAVPDTLKICIFSKPTYIHGVCILICIYVI